MLKKKRLLVAHDNRKQNSYCLNRPSVSPFRICIVSPLLNHEYCIQDGNLDACFVANILREILCSRVNPDTCGQANSIGIRMRVNVGIFNLERNSCGFKGNPETCGQGLKWYGITIDTRGIS